jgi:hypothetical protein
MVITKMKTVVAVESLTRAAVLRRRFPSAYSFAHGHAQRVF